MPPRLPSSLNNNKQTEKNKTKIQTFLELEENCVKATLSFLLIFFFLAKKWDL